MRFASVLVALNWFPPWRKRQLSLLGLSHETDMLVLSSASNNGLRPRLVLVLPTERAPGANTKANRRSSHYFEEVDYYLLR